MKNDFKISSVIIAKNEEANIARCIESQLDCIDEIIVLVDITSTDRTFEIAKSYSKVIVQAVNWMGYSATKEYGVSLSSNDWVFWIDADEAITRELSNEILIFKKNSPRFSAYSVARRAYFLGRWIKHSGWYPGRVNRLFNKNRVSFKDKDIHEYLLVDGSAGELKNDLEHFTDPNIHHYFEKFNRYTTLAAEDLIKKGKKCRLSDLLIRPPFIFIKMYFLRLGFLDGIEGFILAVFSAAYVFTKYCKFWELNKNGK
jgi:glycosyltransferase involved in cell wall biosynthesis